MTDIRTRLADALRRSVPYNIAPTAIVEWSNATADVLLSLPGIAIVELDPNMVEDWDLTISNGIITDADPQDSWSARTARWFAAALLAAAAAADGSGTSG